MKKCARLLFTLSFLLSLFLVTLGVNKTKPATEQKVEASSLTNVTFSELRWNNVDYGGYIGGGTPSDGYCCLVRFAGFTDTATDTTNMATSSYEIGSNFKVNGKSIKDMSGSVVHYVYTDLGSVFFYFKDSEVIYANSYQRITVEIEEGTIFKNAILPYVRIRFEAALGTANGWAVETSTSKTNVTFVEIKWNNTDYNQYGGKAGLNLQFSSNLSTIPNEYNGGIKNRNLRNTNLGEDILYNGTPFKDIADSEIMYFSTDRLWLYIPNWTSNPYNYIRINSTTMLDAILPDVAFTSTGGNWTLANTVNYSGIQWNNVNYGPSDSLATGYKLLIKFNANLSINPDTPDNTNQASSSYDVGNRILVNGVPIKNVGGCNICYPSAQSFLYIYVCDTNLTYTGDYFRPTVYIPSGTLFMNATLPELTFTFNGVLGDSGAWSLVDSPKSYSDVTLNEIVWNNTNNDSTNFGNKNGILLGFSSNLSLNTSSEKNGTILYRNYATTFLGDSLKLNGTSFSSIAGAEIKYYKNSQLWIYAPNMADDYGHYKAEIELVSPSYFLDVEIPRFDFVISGTTWADFSPSTTYLANYVNIHPSWNNVVVSAGYGGLLIQYDKTLGADKDYINQATSAYEIGTNLKINNVSIKDIPDCQVSYAHGVGRLYVVYPLSILYNNGAYSATLTIPSGTKFMSSRLSETTLFYQGDNDSGVWVDADDALISTQDRAVFTTYGSHYGLKFESHLNYQLYNSLSSQYGNSIELGTIILPEDNYINSSVSSFRDFVLTNDPSSSTYMVVRNTKLDFANSDSAASDGYYKYYGSIIDIKQKNIDKNFIGVGYLKVNGTYYFGSDGHNSTNCYSTFLNAYRSGLLNDTTPFAHSINLETNEYSHSLNDVSAISVNHTISAARAGKYYVTATNENITKITIDGKCFNVNIPSGTSTYIYNNNGYLLTDSNDSIKWGIGEPTYELFNEYHFSDGRNSGQNLAILSQSFGTNITRVWADIGVFTRGNCGLINSDGSLDKVEFVQSGIDAMHDVIDEFKSRGMSILLCLSGHAYLRSDKILYNNGNWYSMPEAWSQGIGSAPAPIVPYDSEEEYQQWLRTQRYFFDAVLQEFPEIDSVETNNEIDFGGSEQYRPHYSDPTVLPSSSTIARWSMDVNKALTDSVKANAPHVVVYSPALTCAGNINGTTYTTSSYLRYCYEYIDNYGTGNPDDYFMVMNMHPYLFPSQDNCGTEGAFLFHTGHFPAEGYPGDMPYRTTWENDDWETDWVNYLISIRNIMNDYYDNYKPAAFTEWGIWDVENSEEFYDGDITWCYLNYGNRLSDVYERIGNISKGLNYLESFVFFRMYNFDPNPSDFGTYISGTFGLVNTNLTLKDRGEKVHEIITGSTNHSGIVAILNGMRA